MRQLLILGFYCKVYRREPLCRVYVNDILLDEFNIPHTPYNNIHLSTVGDRLSPQFPNQQLQFLKSTNPFLKYIEFDDLDIEKLNIRIEIKNNDNNYTNGFINKCTLVLLPHVFLFSKKLLDRIDDLKKRWKFSSKNYCIHSKRDVKLFYTGMKYYIFEPLDNNLILDFPDIVQQQWTAEKMKSCYYNWRDLPTIWIDHPSSHWIGSSGCFRLTVKKKFGFWRHSTDLRKGRYKIGQTGFVEYLYDKYKRYEDKRSTGT